MIYDLYRSLIFVTLNFFFSCMTFHMMKTNIANIFAIETIPRNLTIQELAFGQRYDVIFVYNKND